MEDDVKFSEIAIPKDAVKIGPLRPSHKITFTVVLSSKAALPSIHSAGSAHRYDSRMHLTHDELRQKHGAIPAGVKLVESFARWHRLNITEMAAHRRSIQLSGRAEDVAKAFKTSFAEFELNGHRFYAPVQPPVAPRKWSGAVDFVLGLHNSKHSLPRRHSAVHSQAVKASLHDLARAYTFPWGLDGTGQTVGIIEFGGGFYSEDIVDLCTRLGTAAPRITVVTLGKGANRPASRGDVHEFLEVVNGNLHLAAKAEQSDSFLSAQSTAEVTMDIEIVAALAHAAHIVVYFASGEEQGLYHAIGSAVHDEKHRPDILSISWSMPEPTLSRSEMAAIEGVLHEAAHLGITVCASSGDAGALNGSDDGKPSVNYPASSPNCLACGGTSRRVDTAGAHEEIVWNTTHCGVKGASGGGISERFRLPTWQKEAHIPIGSGGNKGRGVPDVAGLADPRYGCELLIAGYTFASAGTSAVAPMWAALIARLNQARSRRCGHLHHALYQFGKERTAALHPVIKGNNGLYRAGEGWNACTGYGTPRGDELLKFLHRISD
jgi:kumamolisin